MASSSASGAPRRPRAPMKAGVTIPPGLAFSDLRLARESDGSVSLDWSVIARICEASALPIGLFQDSLEDNLAQLIVAWYSAHIRNGGAPDPVAEDLITEALAEETAGQGFSLPPGRA